MKKHTFLTMLALACVFLLVFFYSRQMASGQSLQGIWQIQSIDTMKYSRDLSLQELDNPAFDRTIDQQMQEIADTGATYVSIDTPYDPEFLPILHRWVASARAHHLHVWFRGNFSGWEGWFGYSSITRAQHLEKTKAFILNNQDLFQDGDIFTACPECENGGPGDPRNTGDVSGFQTFLIDEYQMTQSAFGQIHKQVITNFDSMNGDVARLVMDKKTTKALGGVVTIDHYVQTGAEMAADVKEIAVQSGGKVVIGEFGAPIPNIQGEMTQAQQAAWLKDALTQLANTGDIIGVNYWTSVGGSTALWNEQGQATIAVQSLTAVYNFHGISGKVSDIYRHPVANVKITIEGKNVVSSADGTFHSPYLVGYQTLTVSAPDYVSQSMKVNNNSNLQITLQAKNKSIFFILKQFLGLS